MTRLSDHFSAEDLRCSCQTCGGSLRISLVLVGMLEEIRYYYNRRVHVLAGYRCEARLKELKRSRKSYHGLGKAVDIHLSGISSQDLFDFCRGFKAIKGLGYYPEQDFVHIDLRDQKERFEFVNLRGEYLPLTGDLAATYGLKMVDHAAAASA